MNLAVFWGLIEESIHRAELGVNAHYSLYPKPFAGGIDNHFLELAMAAADVRGEKSRTADSRLLSEGKMTIPVNGIHKIGKLCLYLSLTLVACAGSFARPYPPTLLSPPPVAICPPTDTFGISAARIGESLNLGNGTIMEVSPDEMARFRKAADREVQDGP